MKKLLVRIIVVLLAIAVVLVLAGFLLMNSMVKKGIETAGPKIAKVDMKVAGVSVSLFSGKGSISGLVIGNPEGFKTPSAIKIGTASVAVKPSSVFADKIVVQSVNVQSPEITFEGSLSGNNLSKILANIEAYTGSEKNGPQPGEKKAQKKIQVDDFVISGGKINLSLTMMGGKSAVVPLPEINLTNSIPLPEIHLSNLGTGAEGITPAELSKQVLKAIIDSTTKAVAAAMTDLGKGVSDAARNLPGTVEAAGKAAKSITDLFKKK